MTNTRGYPSSYLVALGASLFLVLSGAAAEPPALTKKTYTYKTVDGVKIAADVPSLVTKLSRPVR
jgi:hypothetical protein